MDIIAIFGLLIHLLQTSLTRACPINITASSLFCTRPVEQRYNVIVEQFISGNDSGVPELCKSYSIMLHCLHEALSDCGRLGREAWAEVAYPLQDTVGKYCQYYREEHQLYIQPGTSHVVHYQRSSASSQHGLTFTYSAVRKYLTPRFDTVQTNCLIVLYALTAHNLF